MGQLHYSVGLLMLVSVLMGLMFWLPVVGLWFPSPTARLLSLTALGMMMASYTPTLKFYARSIGWALALPLIASLYLAMTWTSAFRFWKGAGARWKGRYYTGK